MEPGELTELHYITPINNVPSIMQRGILSHVRAAKFTHESVAADEIQALREGTVVPGGRRLHKYANLYLTARNPMLYKLQEQHRRLTILRIQPEVIEIPGTVIADGIASSDYTAFRPAPGGLQLVDSDLVFAEYWTDPDKIVMYKKKRAKCAEVLVPDRVHEKYIFGAYVSTADSLAALNAIGFNRPIEISPRLFIR